MTIGEFLQEKLNEYELNDYVLEKNLEYNWVRFSGCGTSNYTANFANFLKDCGLVEFRGNADKSVTCWF